MTVPMRVPLLDLRAQYGALRDEVRAAGRAEAWNRSFFETLGLYRLRGTIQYPEAALCHDLNDHW